jgi:hypothetical protein
MSARAAALAVAAASLVASGCSWIALEQAPLPESWDLFLLSVVVLMVIFWITLLIGVAMVLLLLLHAAASRFANQNAKPSYQRVYRFG